jgi:hypothetical protein
MLRRSDPHGCAVVVRMRHAHQEPVGPHVLLSHAVAAAVVRDADDRPPSVIANGNERAASRFAYCMASAIVDDGW